MKLLRRVILLCLFSGPCLAEPGRFIFEGHPAAPGSAVIGSNRVDAARFPCASCHRRDGRGGGEGDAPSIVWETLTQPAKDRPAYNATSFASLLSEGVRPSGRQISRLMPRYDFDDPTIDALIAHLAAISVEQRVGIYPDRIVFGVPIPNGDKSRANRLLNSLNAAFAQELPRNGLFGRKVELHPLSDDTATIDLQVTAVLSPTPTSQKAMDRFIEAGVPVLFPSIPIAQDADPMLLRSFYASRDRVIDTIARKMAIDGCRQIAVLAEDRSDFVQIETAISEVAVSQPVIVPQANKADCILVTADNLIVTRLSDQTKAKAIYVLPTGLSPLLDHLSDYRGEVIVGRHDAIAVKLALAEEVPLLDAHAKLIAATLNIALREAGRDLTRTSLVLGLDDMARSEFSVNFAAGPLGSDEVIFQVLSMGDDDRN